jgi:hypothetical protein
MRRLPIHFVRQRFYRKQPLLKVRGIAQKWDLTGSRCLIRRGCSVCWDIQSEALNMRDRVVIVDDILASGGTALAAVKLIEKAGGTAHPPQRLGSQHPSSKGRQPGHATLARFPLKSEIVVLPIR